jgi:hypothetical protein
MKKFNLIIIAVLFFLLISCAGSAKKKGEEAKKANETAKQTTEVTKKTEEPSADEKSAFEDSAAADNVESPNEQTAQAGTDTENPADEIPSLETESPAQEVAAVTPPAQTQPQTPPVQTPQQPAQTAQQSPAQAPPQQPPAQTQPQTPPAQTQQQTPPTDTDEKKSAASDSDSSDSDSQTKKEPSPFIAGGGYAPAQRIESVLQMGTMPNDKEIVFSRIVHATVGQIVEIPFRGNGWIYLGEIASQRGVAYNSRRNDYDGQTFIFTLEEPGTYVLKFYRQDFIRDYILNDHVQVVVGDAPTAGAGWLNPPVDRGKVVAQPRWPSPIEETQIRSGTKPVSEPVVTTGTTEQTKAPTPAPSVTTPTNAAPQQKPAAETTAPQKTTPAPSANTQDKTPAPSSSAAATTQIPPIKAIEPSENEKASAEKKETLSPEAVTQKAKENFDGGNIPAAIALLDQFMTDYPGGSDEVYWLLGQYYEANSPSRNILLSLDYYRRLVNEYPQSKRFNEARRRIAYLERYYINIQ